MKKTNVNIERYIVNDGWFVDIEETEEGFGAWIYETDGGYKMFMFGGPKHQPDAKVKYYTKEMFIELVKANLSDYMDEYLQDMYDQELWYSLLDQISEERLDVSSLN